jgi:hypothetical protein
LVETALVAQVLSLAAALLLETFFSSLTFPVRLWTFLLSSLLLKQRLLRLLLLLQLTLRKALLWTFLES